MSRATASRLALPVLVAAAIGTLAALTRPVSSGTRHPGSRSITFGHSVKGKPASAVAARAGHRLGRPRLDRDPIPYGRKRKHEMAAYSARHYGRRGWRLRHPHVIVLHF